MIQKNYIIYIFSKLARTQYRKTLTQTLIRHGHGHRDT